MIVIFNKFFNFFKETKNAAKDAEDKASLYFKIKVVAPIIAGFMTIVIAASVILFTLAALTTAEAFFKNKIAQAQDAYLKGWADVGYSLEKFFENINKNNNDDKKDEKDNHAAEKFSDYLVESMQALSKEASEGKTGDINEKKLVAVGWVYNKFFKQTFIDIKDVLVPTGAPPNVTYTLMNIVDARKTKGDNINVFDLEAFDMIGGGLDNIMNTDFAAVYSKAVDKNKSKITAKESEENKKIYQDNAVKIQSDIMDLTLDLNKSMVKIMGNNYDISGKNGWDKARTIYAKDTPNISLGNTDKKPEAFFNEKDASLTQIQTQEDFDNFCAYMNLYLSKYNNYINQTIADESKRKEVYNDFATIANRGGVKEKYSYIEYINVIRSNCSKAVKDNNAKITKDLATDTYKVDVAQIVKTLNLDNTDNVQIEYKRLLKAETPTDSYEFHYLDLSGVSDAVSSGESGFLKAHTGSIYNASKDAIKDSKNNLIIAAVTKNDKTNLIPNAIKDIQKYKEDSIKAIDAAITDYNKQLNGSSGNTLVDGFTVPQTQDKIKELRKEKDELNSLKLSDNAKDYPIESADNVKNLIHSDTADKDKKDAKNLDMTDWKTPGTKSTTNMTKDDDKKLVTDDGGVVIFNYKYTVEECVKIVARNFYASTVQAMANGTYRGMLGIFQFGSSSGGSLSGNIKDGTAMNVYTTGYNDAGETAYGGIGIVGLTAAMGFAGDNNECDTYKQRIVQVDKGPQKAIGIYLITDKTGVHDDTNAGLSNVPGGSYYNHHVVTLDLYVNDDGGSVTGESHAIIGPKMSDSDYSMFKTYSRAGNVNAIKKLMQKYLDGSGSVSTNGSTDNNTNINTTNTNKSTTDNSTPKKVLKDKYHDDKGTLTDWFNYFKDNGVFKNAQKYTQKWAEVCQNSGINDDYNIAEADNYADTIKKDIFAYSNENRAFSALDSDKIQNILGGIINAESAFIPNASTTGDYITTHPKDSDDLYDFRNLAILYPSYNIRNSSAKYNISNPYPDGRTPAKLQIYEYDGHYIEGHSPKAGLGLIEYNNDNYTMAQNEEKYNLGDLRLSSLKNEIYLIGDKFMSCAKDDKLGKKDIRFAILGYHIGKDEAIKLLAKYNNPKDYDELKKNFKASPDSGNDIYEEYINKVLTGSDSGLTNGYNDKVQQTIDGEDIFYKNWQAAKSLLTQIYNTIYQDNEPDGMGGGGSNGPLTLPDGGKSSGDGIDYPPNINIDINDYKSRFASLSPDEKRQLVVAYAEKFAGCPYTTGGKGPNTFDCSGLVWYVYSQIGVSEIGDYHITQDYASGYASYRIPFNENNLSDYDNLKLGDAIICNNSGHVVIYIGKYDGVHYVINATKPGSYVLKQPLAGHIRSGVQGVYRFIRD